MADYLDLVLNESSADAKQAWRDGIAALDAASTSQFGKPFADLTGEQQLAIVTQAARNEGQPVTPLETFFGEAKGRTIHGYYTSEIGIHQELKVQGQPVPAGVRRVQSPRTYVLTGLGQVGSGFTYAPSRLRAIVVVSRVGRAERNL